MSAAMSHANISPPKVRIDGNRFLSGFVAGCVSRTLTAPIDRVKILRQIANQDIAGKSMLQCFMVMLKEGGIRSLWRGNGVNVFKNGPETALRFGFHSILKDWLFPNTHDLQHTQRLFVASLAGASSMTCVYPIEVIKTRLAIRLSADSSSVLHCLRILLKQGGFWSLYRGYSVSLLSYVPYSGLELSLYELFKRKYLERFHGYSPGDCLPRLPCLSTLSISLVSGLIPMLLVYPANLLRTRFQASQGSRGQPIYASLRALYSQTGVAGLYRGFGASLTKSLPTVTLSYLTVESMNSYLKVPALGSK